MKTPKQMTARELNVRAERAELKRAALVDEFIAQGRGTERDDETRTKTDPLSRKWNELAEEYADLMVEMEVRYGTRPPGCRLPIQRGAFGPREKP